MKLTYRGVSYETHPTQVPVMGKKNLVRFRGCQYELSEAIVNLSKPMESSQVYRGISLSHGKKAHFLGQSYEMKQISLVQAYS